MSTRFNGRFIHFDNGTTWPNPTELDELDHVLRYGEPSREDLLMAASVVSAYTALLAEKNVENATEHFRCIRRAIKARKNTSERRESEG